MRDLNQEETLKLANIVCTQANVCENNRSTLLCAIRSFFVTPTISMSYDYFSSMLRSYIHTSVMAVALVDSIVKNYWPKGE